MQDRLNLGIRLHDTPKMSLEERLNYISGQGLTCAQVVLHKLLDGADSDNAAFTPGYAMALKHLFDQYKIEPAVLGCYLNLANPDPAQLHKIQNRYRAHLRLASYMGGCVVATETGAPNTEYRYVPECHTEEAFQAFLRGLDPVVDCAEKMGVVLAIEPVYTHIVYTPKLARRMLDEIASPNLQILLDPLNLIHIDNYENLDAIIDEALELLGENIVAMHIKDFVKNGDGLTWVAAGQGGLDQRKILRYVKDFKPYMHCLLEDSLPENAAQAAEYVRRVYREC